VRHEGLTDHARGRDEGCIVGEGRERAGRSEHGVLPDQAYWESIRSYRLAEQSVFNAGYWQLRQITLGYDLTPHLNGAFGIQQLRLNLSANNVWLIKKWVPHVHRSRTRSSVTVQGLESTGMPVRGVWAST
jgi:hypothetical protein